MIALTAQQEAIIAHRDGHARIIAVAGAGKTTTLAHFIRARIAEGVNPRRLLILMYNRNTRLEFQQRLSALLPDRQPQPDVRTFHSLGLAIYRKLAERGLLPPLHLPVISSGECEGTVWRLLMQVADADTAADILDQKQKWVEPALTFIEQVKTELQTPEETFAQSGLPERCRIFIETFHRFESWRQQQGRITYADMIYEPCLLFRARPEVADDFSGHMHYVLVDEYQDINQAQQCLLDVILAKGGALVAVGDPDQTIYEFRGSRPEFMLTLFEEKYRGHQRYPLTQTFRYGHELALTANHLISHNQQREPVLATPVESTPLTRVHRHQTLHYANSVARIVRDAMTRYLPEQIAVLNRVWAVSAPIELALLANNIPYNLHHETSVLDRHELQPFLLLFEISAGHLPEHPPQYRKEAWRAYLTVPYPKVKRELLDQLADAMVPVSANYAFALANRLPTQLSTWQKDQILTRCTSLQQAETGALSAYDLAKAHAQSTDYLSGVEENTFSQRQGQDRSATVSAFLAYLRNQNLKAQDACSHLLQLRSRHQNNQSGVNLCSIHKAKGLEWPVVIIPNLTDYYYPYLHDSDDFRPRPPSSEIESERRLLYVAMTRARHELHLIEPDISGSNRDVASPFLQECHYEASQKVAQSIHGAEPQVQLNADSIPLVSAYLKAIGSPLHLEVSTHESPTPRRRTPSASLPIVHHSAFGPGQLVDDCDQYWHIRFDDGRLRKISKALATELLSWT